MIDLRDFMLSNILKEYVSEFTHEMTGEPYDATYFYEFIDGKAKEPPAMWDEFEEYVMDQICVHPMKPRHAQARPLK